MENFTAHSLEFTCEVTTPMLLQEYKGGELRGALFHALRRQFCVQRRRDDCRDCPTVAACPIAYLMATVQEDGWRGVYVPRPFVLAWGADQSAALGGKPQTRYEVGERFRFKLTLFGRAVELFPYIVVAARELERLGMGRKVEENRWRRGTFKVVEIEAVNPLLFQYSKASREEPPGESSPPHISSAQCNTFSTSGQRKTRLLGVYQPVLNGNGIVQAPNVPITHEQICAAVHEGTRRHTKGTLTAEFLTPTRITDKKRLVRRAEFRPFFQRLLERVSALAKGFSDTPLEVDFPALVELAAEVETVRDETRWVELMSYSARQRRQTPTSGFMGRVTWRATDWMPFLPILWWGTVTHVGKDAVKGNGMYRIR